MTLPGVDEAGTWAGSRGRTLNYAAVRRDAPHR